MSLPTKTADPMPTKQPIHECRPATIKQEPKKQLKLEENQFTIL
jgi:hypothetical protein